MTDEQCPTCGTIYRFMPDLGCPGCFAGLPKISATSWVNPVPFKLIETHDSESFRDMPEGRTGLPLFPHKGAFAVPRRFHTHEGVDLYVPEHTPVVAVEDGVIVDVQHFTGVQASPPTPWWNDTSAVLIEGATGVVVYGEIVPNGDIKPGMTIEAGTLVGYVKRVLRIDKGRPMSMLHLELHAHGATQCLGWEDRPPATLRDPTPYLLRIQ